MLSTRKLYEDRLGLLSLDTKDDLVLSPVGLKAQNIPITALKLCLASFLNTHTHSSLYGNLVLKLPLYQLLCFVKATFELAMT